MDSEGRRDDHRTYEDMAVAHVMGGLDQDDGRVFRAHLLECGDCRARVGELRAIAHELAGVERDERRVRSAQTVEMKSREDGEDSEAPPEPRRGWTWVSRVAAFAGVAVVVLLVAYVFTLRGQVISLEQRVEQQREASAVLEHGDKLTIIHSAPEVSDATIKRRNDDVVVMLEGLDDEAVYGLYLVSETDGGTTTVLREPRRAEGGTLFVLFGLRGNEDRFVVTDASEGLSLDPTGTPVFEANLGRYADG